RLSVFAGGCTLEAVEVICNPDGTLPLDVLDGVVSLVDKSLLRQEEQALREGAEPRFSMLETIREYARERLEEHERSEGQAQAVRRRHAGFYLTLAEKADYQTLVPGDSMPLWRVEAEQDNLR